MKSERTDPIGPALLLLVSVFAYPGQITAGAGRDSVTRLRREDKMMKRIGLAGILVLVVMGILSIFGSAGADGNPEVTLNAPSLYIMKTNPQEGDGYTFTVNLPEGMENDSVEDWSLSVSSNRVTIYSSDKEAAGIYTGSFTIPYSVLTTNGAECDVNLSLRLSGYGYTWAWAYFTIVEAPYGEKPITITLIDTYGNVVENPVINELYTAKIQGDESMNRLRVWNGYSWTTVNKNSWNSYETQMESNYTAFAAYGSTDGGTTWCSFNAKEYTFASAGRLAAPTVTLDRTNATYTRGEEITVTVSKSAHATNYLLSASGNGSAGYQKEAETDGSGEGTLTFKIPTEHMSAGAYRIYVKNYAVGYKGNEVGPARFTIQAGTETQEATIRVYPQNPSAADDMEVYAYVPNTSMAQLCITRNGETVLNQQKSKVYDCFIWTGLGSLEGGEYTFAVYASGAAEPATEQQMIIAPAERLEEVTVTGLERFILLGEPFCPGIQAVDHAESYQAELWFSANDNIYHKVLTKQVMANGAESVPIDFPGNAVQTPGYYYFRVTARANGWQESREKIYYFTILDPVQMEDEDHPIQLTILNSAGEATDRTTWYTSEGIPRIRITAPNATTVRLWNGAYWENNLTKENGAWIYMPNNKEGSYQLVAQAKYTTGGDWISTSHFINLRFIRRVLPEPDITETNLIGGMLTRGETIWINIGRDPAVSGESFSYIWYYANIYTADATQTKPPVKSGIFNSTDRNFVIPTDDLAAGNYRIRIAVEAYPGGWENGERYFSFTLAEPAESIEGYTFAFSAVQADGTPLTEVESETEGTRIYQFRNYEEVELLLDADDIEGYTKTYRLSDGTGTTITLEPGTDGKARKIYTTFTYVAEMIRSYQAYVIYTPEDETKPILTAARKIEFRVSEMKKLTDFGSVPKLYVIGTEGGLYVTVNLPEDLEVSDIVDWYIMLDCAAGHKIARKMSDGMTTLAKGTNRIPIPDSELQGEERYLVYFRIQIKGYAESAINDTITVLGEEPDTLVLPAGLLRIEDYAFEGGAFQAVIIPDGCTEIGAGAFANCSNLIYVSYPEGMAIGDGAFAGCGTGIVLDER